MQCEVAAFDPDASCPTIDAKLAAAVARRLADVTDILAGLDGKPRAKRNRSVRTAASRLAALARRARAAKLDDACRSGLRAAVENLRQRVAMLGC